ncbi:MAG: hypothetical protein ISS36_03515 [Candidatus Aenigmarchaeota archaeon]|nr:hypothetical protein [Candidatus Aenigmarchaeota archaeon]
MALKKTLDGRFVEKRVKISSSLLQRIILDTKKHNEFTWNSFANYLGISTYTLRHDYLKGINTLPLSTLHKIININSELEWKIIKEKIKIINPFWGQKIIKYKNVNFPDTFSEKFAEFYGIMLGDGCIYSNISGFCITCDAVLDKPFMEYVKLLIIDLFGIEPKLYYSRNERVVRCVVYSQELVRFLVKNGIPLGIKSKNYKTIPKKYFTKKELLKTLIRGLMDTDGSVFPHPGAKIVSDISIKNNSLLIDFIKAFKKLDFPVKSTKDRIYFSGSEKLKKYFYLFGSSNPKHIIKYKTFIKGNKIPKSNELVNLFKENSLKMKLPYYGPVV